MAEQIPEAWIGQEVSVYFGSEVHRHRVILGHRFGAAGALDRARLVDRPVRRIGASRLLRLSRQGVSLDAQGAGRRDTARCRAWTRPDLGRNSPLLERPLL